MGEPQPVTPGQLNWTHKRWVSLLGRLHEIVEVAKTMARILDGLVNLPGTLTETPPEATLPAYRYDRSLIWRRSAAMLSRRSRMSESTAMLNPAGG